MNISTILSKIAQADTEDFERQSPRRDLLRTAVKGAALAAVPMALSALFNRAGAQTSSNPIADALNGMLLLEYLQEDFYTSGLDASIKSSSPLIPSGLEQSAIIDIRNHATAHIGTLKAFIAKKSGTPIAKPKFDFTGGKGTPAGKYSDVFSNYDVFMALAQCFEDITVRAYKNLMPIVMADNDLVTASMRLHSVEARHAAHIRQMRAAAPGPLLTGTLKPWITLDDSNIADPDLSVPYVGEENTLQSNIQIRDINGQTIDDKAASEAYDEPQDASVVAGFVTAFIITP